MASTRTEHRGVVRIAGLVAVVIGAMALSFAGQVQAVSPLLGDQLGGVLALTQDAATMLALHALLTSATGSSARKWAWAVLVLAGGMSLMLNTWHALSSDSLPTAVALAVGAGPVILVALLSHLLALTLTPEHTENPGVPEGLGPMPMTIVPITTWPVPVDNGRTNNPSAITDGHADGGRTVRRSITDGRTSTRTDGRRTTTRPRTTNGRTNRPVARTTRARTTDADELSAELVDAAETVAAELVAAGQRVTRDALAHALRRSGTSVPNAVASTLLAVVRDGRTTDTPPTNHGQTAGDSHPDDARTDEAPASADGWTLTADADETNVVDLASASGRTGVGR